MKTQRTKDKGFGTGCEGKGDRVMTDKRRQDTGAEPRRRVRPTPSPVR